MRFQPKYLFVSTLFFFLLFNTVTVFALQRDLSFTPRSPMGEEVKGNQWLFVIGINSYINWPRLKTAVNDAKAVKDVLLRRYYFNKSYVIELYDENATREKILGQLRSLAKKVRPEDSLVIYYAGHGYIDPITKEGKWIPVESGREETSAWISNHDVKNYLRTDAIKAKHILLVSDSCFSGDFFRGKRGKLPAVTDKVIQKAYKYSSRQAITSGGLEPVSDDGFGNNSVFAHFFVKALKENQKPFLIPSDLFAYVRAGVAENAEQLPRLGSLKDTGGQHGGELVFFLKQENKINVLAQSAKEKKAMIKRLAKREKESKANKEKEQAKIIAMEEEISELDKQIKYMKNRLGTSSEKSKDSLDNLLAMVKQSDELERRKEEEVNKRKEEITRLKKEKSDKMKKKLLADILKYEEIISSKHGKDLKETAWNSLVEKYPDARGVDYGNLIALKDKLLMPLILSDAGYIDNDDGTITDIKTDLMWMKKDSYADTKKCMDWNVSKSYVKRLNTGGHGDWRLPTVKELQGIYKNSIQSLPIFNKTKLDPMFPGGANNNYWSSETYGSCCALYVDFSNGYFAEETRDSCSGQDVRAVRPLKEEQDQMKVASIPSGAFKEERRSMDVRYIDNGHGTITDTLTGLIWSKKDSYADLGRCLDWNASKSYVNTLHAGGYNDWRMPTVNELKSIYKESKNNKSSSGKTTHSDPIFPSNSSQWHWSSETTLLGCGFFKSCAFLVSFDHGYVDKYTQGTCRNTGVRSVRGTSKLMRKQPVKKEEDDY